MNRICFLFGWENAQRIAITPIMSTTKRPIPECPCNYEEQVSKMNLAAIQLKVILEEPTKIQKNTNTNHFHNQKAKSKCPCHDGQQVSMVDVMWGPAVQSVRECALLSATSTKLPPTNFHAA